MSIALKRPEPRAVPKQVRAQERRSAILLAANSFVMEGLVEDVTTTNIAQRANIPVGSVYRYFDDRTHILDELYRSAFAEIESDLERAQANSETGWPIGKTIHHLLSHFWKTARAHPTFRVLTRWANQQYSLWDVTPGPNSNLATLIQQTLASSGIRIHPARQYAASKTLVTTASVLVDMSIEESNEEKAEALIKELAVLLEAYVNTLDKAV